MPKINFEADDLPELTVAYDYYAEWQDEERDTGTHAGWIITGEIIGGHIGCLPIKGREDVIRALTSLANGKHSYDEGRAAVRRLEAQAEEMARAAEDDAAEADALDRGDWMRERRRDAALNGWVAE